MKRILYLLMLSLLVISCKDDDSYSTGDYFTLLETQVNFDNSEGEKTVEYINAQGETKATVVSENSDWCTAGITDNKVVIKVQASILATSRVAKVLVTSGSAKAEILVRQSQKMDFSNIPAVKNLEAIPGAGEMTLKWEIPEEDNFSHVIISYTTLGELKEITVDSGVTEYTIIDLMNSEGEYLFKVQSIDKERELGEVVTITALPEKLVALRFQEADLQLVPYHFRISNTHTATIKVGSREFFENENILISFETDESVLDNYNAEHGTDIQLLSADRYSLPTNYLYTSTTDFQDMSIEVDISDLEDYKNYGLPIRIQSGTPTTVISKVMSSMVIVFSVDDFSGWYTVDRLPNCGEEAGKYPSDAKDRRRYIKRTGKTTWETGYLFRTYSESETQTGSGSDVQYIKLDPETKLIHIQQGSNAVAESRNSFDPETNELHIEYLYVEWKGWWNHERMYNKSSVR